MLSSLILKLLLLDIVESLWKGHIHTYTHIKLIIEKGENIYMRHEGVKPKYSTKKKKPKKREKQKGKKLHYEKQKLGRPKRSMKNLSRIKMDKTT